MLDSLVFLHYSVFFVRKEELILCINRMEYFRSMFQKAENIVFRFLLDFQRIQLIVFVFADDDLADLVHQAVGYLGNGLYELS